jgi:VWFA-related protein
MDAHDEVALYAMAGQVTVLNDFTNDSRALVRALDTYRPSLAMADNTSGVGRIDSLGPLGRPNGGAMLQQRAAQQSADEEEGFFIQRRVDKTVEAFQAIATHLAGIPGRKNIVWLTTGFPFAVNYDPMAPGMRFNRSTGMFDIVGQAITSMSPQLQKAARAFNDANMAIYPVDVRGLMTLPEFSAARRTFSNEPGVSTGQTEIDSMIDIAERTGGRAFYETNGITEAIQSAASDARVTYLLGYYSADSNYDGKFHDIKIKTTKPGVTLRYRRGYFALPPEQPGTSEHPDVFAQAIWSPLEATSLGVTVRARRRTQGGNAEARLAVRIDPRNLRLENLNGRWVGEIELVIVNLSPTGQNLKGFDQTRKLKLLPSTYERIEREGLEFPLRFRIPPETERIRLVVRDGPSGAMGSVTIPLSQVPRT